jgi:hypothetical protein
VPGAPACAPRRDDRAEHRQDVERALVRVQGLHVLASGRMRDADVVERRRDVAPHIHARVGWGESLTFNGQPYGGQSVRPRRLRCWTCTNPDVDKATGGFYTQFWHGRWMRH